MLKQNIIVLDLETKRTFEDVGGRDNLGALGVSMVGVYSYRHNEYQAYFENDFPKLFSVLSEKPLVIGFNHRRFDMPVLQPYFKDFDLKQLKLLDVMEELTKTLGHRIGLDAVAQATLGAKKSGHGLDAIRYWNTGDLENLKKYCLEDVRLTKEVYEYGAKHGELFFMDKFGTGKIKVAVNWKFEGEQAPQETTKQFSLF
ncbi:MAG: ribonuclease H-like domain-containing protein [Deltaproteobacteria bacterium]|nr:ribonuclease H-like domain-containing protein [Deltaproteobacteria bacterium]